MLNAQDKENLVKSSQTATLLVQDLQCLAKSPSSLLSEIALELLQQAVQVDRRLSRVVTLVFTPSTEDFCKNLAFRPIAPPPGKKISDIAEMMLKGLLLHKDATSEERLMHNEAIARWMNPQPEDIKAYNEAVASLEKPQPDGEE